MAYNTDAVLDAPDATVRKIMQKRADGAPLTDQEYKRLAARTGAEAQMGKEGGTVQQPVNPRQLTPYEKGAADRAYQDAYNAGQKGAPPPQDQQSTGGQEGPNSRAADPRGGIDVRGYVGSMWAKPGSYAAMRPIGGAAPRVGDPGGGIQVRKYAGSMAAGAEPVIGEGQQAPTGRPPMAATNGPVSAPQPPAAGGPMSLGGFTQNIKPKPLVTGAMTPPTYSQPRSTTPLRGNVKLLNASQIAAASRPGGAFTKKPLPLPQ